MIGSFHGERRGIEQTRDMLLKSGLALLAELRFVKTSPAPKRHSFSSALKIVGWTPSSVRFQLNKTRTRASKLRFSTRC